MTDVISRASQVQSYFSSHTFSCTCLFGFVPFVCT